MYYLCIRLGSYCSGQHILLYPSPVAVGDVMANNHYSLIAYLLTHFHGVLTFRREDVSEWEK